MSREGSGLVYQVACNTVPETTATGFDLAALGRAGRRHRYEVTEAGMQAYAEATDDVSGGPVFAIVPVWNTIAPASKAVVSGDARRFVVHYEHDMLLHRPLEAGMRVVSHATPVAVLPRPNGTSLVIRTETRDEDGELVNEQYVTEFFRGVQADEGRGERAPDHRLEADGDPVAEVTYLVAPDQSVRYAAASGDDFAIHLLDLDQRPEAVALVVEETRLLRVDLRDAHRRRWEREQDRVGGLIDRHDQHL